MSKIQYIKLDTSERINPLTTTPSQCKIHSSSYTFEGTYALAYAYIPVTFYNVNASNNLFYFTDTDARVATITVGFYDSVSVLVALAAAMNTASTSTIYAVSSRNSATKCVTIASSSNNFVLNLSNTVNSIASLLGFTSLYDTMSSMGVISDTMANLAQVKSFNMNINGLSSVISLSGQSAYSFILPITVATPSILIHEPSTFIQTITFERPTRDILLTMYDDNHNVIQLQEDFFIVLKPM